MESSEVIIYTDGACSGNPGAGGWAAVIFSNNAKKTVSGYASNTTNNIMELTAAVEGLKHANATIITLFTDSQYLCKGMTEWLVGWKRKGWRTASGQAVKNLSIWQELDRLNNKYKINWQWVKAHNGNKYNEEADQLAREEIEKNA